MRRPGPIVLLLWFAALLCAAAAPAPALAAKRRAAPNPFLASLSTASGQRPGPAILYRAPATAPPLTNTGIWKAAPILVSGSSAYRAGEYLYQDYLYDDHGAHLTPDLTNPQAQQLSDLFSMPGGTVTYPTAAAYANNAADLVELRIKPLRSATAFRVTLNTLTDPGLIAFSIAIGGIPGQPHPFPFGANVSAPADLFLTVHPQGARLVGTLSAAASAGLPSGHPAPTVKVDRARHQIEVDVPHADWNPGRRTVRLAAGVGLWDAARGSYLVPQPTADAGHPGGAGISPHPAAFLNVAFRFHEPLPSVTASTGAVLDTAWWRDHDQGHALAAGDISSLYANVDFGKLLRRSTDNSAVPSAGPMDRILSTHFNLGPGVQYAHMCGFGGALAPNSCTPEYLGQLQPYAVYIPGRPTDHGRYGLTLLLHSLSANYNQFIGSRNQSQLANRPQSSIVITTESRGPDQFYQGVGGAEVFEAWADIARRYRLDPAFSDITGYSMGGFGTFRLGEQFPDLFARAQPTVGEETDHDLLASLRNLPVLMWNNVADELVNPALYLADAGSLRSLGLRYELDVFQPCVSLGCSPLFPDHLELAVNDQYAPAAAFLGTTHVNPNPAHVTYVDDPARNRAELGLDGDHAYWVSQIRLRNPSLAGPGGEPIGTVDAISHGFGVGDPPSSTLSGGLTGTLTGGNLGALTFLPSGTTWGAAPRAPAANRVDITATNVASVTIDPRRAHVSCFATIGVHSDGPMSITLRGCRRVVRIG